VPPRPLGTTTLFLVRKTFAILAGATNSLQRMVVGRSVVAVADPDFSSARTLCFILGGVCATDCGFVAGAACGGTGGGWSRASAGGHAGAGISAGLRIGNFVVRGHVLLDL